jgi:hypothetical protein
MINPRLVDTNDIPWIISNKEYIIFLDVGMICEHENTIFYSTNPQLSSSESFGMYAIEDNYVQIPGDDFGIGISVYLPEFIEFLNNKISEIKNYNGN